MNAETYPWTQADEEEYDSNAGPEEQAEQGALDAYHAVPSYFERYQPQEQVPFLGQRCHVEKKGFGTIVALSELDGVPHAQVHLDGGKRPWIKVELLELLELPAA